MSTEPTAVSASLRDRAFSAALTHAQTDSTIVFPCRRSGYLSFFMKLSRTILEPVEQPLWDGEPADHLFFQSIHSAK